jgi:hypothetical protein
MNESYHKVTYHPPLGPFTSVRRLDFDNLKQLVNDKFINNKQNMLILFLV